MEGKKYAKVAVENINDFLAENVREIKGGKREHSGPFPPSYLPELDVTKECNEEHASIFRQIIGIYRWIIEPGRIDMSIEVSLLSKYKASLRERYL